MGIEGLVNLRTLSANLIVRRLIPFASVLLIVVSLYFVFVVVPNEQVMGPVQRIFYFHVGSAMTAYFLIGVLFVASVFYLVSKKQAWDVLAAAAGSSALLFCSIVLLTGMIWGHSAWNAWWRWEPRLVSFLVLWLLLCSYHIFRTLMAKEARLGRVAAVLGVLIAVNVPIVIFSIKFLDHTQQLHPEVVGNRGLDDIRFVFALLLSTVSILLLSVWLTLVKLTNLLLGMELEQVERQLRMNNYA